MDDIVKMLQLDGLSPSRILEFERDGKGSAISFSRPDKSECDLFKQEQLDHFHSEGLREKENLERYSD